MKRDYGFELQYKDEQIQELKTALAGTIIENGSYSNAENKWDINYSSILTKLIQEAGRWCEHYASDLFVLWKHNIEDKLENGTLETGQFVFAMYGNGINNKEQYEYHNKNYEQDYHYYRAIWFLDVETNDGKIKMTLHR